MTKAEIHTKISYVKSGLRILGYLVLMVISPLAATILVMSEVLGIAEEVFGA